MTKVIFETAVLAGAVANAARIAPTSGKEVDTFAGMFIEVRPNEDHAHEVNIRAANGDVFYTEYLDAVEVQGEAVDWRVPSMSIGGFMKSLPMGTGRQVTMEQIGGVMRLTQGRAQCEFSLIPPEMYPDWEMFESGEVLPVRGFGERITQVSWAADKGNVPPINGVYIDGERLVATDRYRIATVPCKLELGESEPVAVPVSILGPILSQMVDIKAGVIGNFLCIAPNDYTQIKCVLFADPYPNVDRMLGIDLPDVIMLDRDLTADMAQRCLAIVRSDRQIALRVTIGNGEIEFFVQGESKTERTVDAMDLPGQADHPPVEIYFGPENFTDSVTKAPNKEIMMFYNSNNEKSPVRFDGGSGYEVVVQPRTKAAVEAASGGD